MKMIICHPIDHSKIYLKNENYMSIHSVILKKESIHSGVGAGIFLVMLCFSNESSHNV